jgi:putative flippase GtrA
MKHRSLILSVFVKAQCSSAFSTFFDFALTFFFTKLIGLWYILSSCIGTLTGGVINFLLNRLWVFDAKDRSSKVQVKKFIIIWIGNLSLNSMGIYLLTDIMKIQYLISKSIVGISVGVFYNFASTGIREGFKFDF